MSNIFDKIKSINFRNVIYTFLLYFVIIFTMVFGQITNANDGSFGNGMALSTAIIIYLIIIGLYALLSFIAFKQKICKFDTKLKISIFIGLFILLYMILIVSLTDYASLEPFKSGAKEITQLDKVYSIMDFSLLILLIYCCFFLLPKYKEKDLFLRIAAYLVFVFCLIAIVYSLVTEWDLYIEQIQKASFFDKNYSGAWIKSFFAYGNVFGHLMFIGSLFVTFLAITYKNKYIFLFNIISLIFIFFSGSRTGAIAELILFFLFIIYSIIGLYKKNKIAFYLISTVFIFLLIFLLLDMFCFHLIKIDQTKGEVTTTYTLYDIYELFLDSMTSRFKISSDYFNGLPLNNILLGLGYDINDYYLRAKIGIFNLHNGYTEIFSTGGIVLSVFYLFLFVYLFVLAFKTTKNKGNNYIYLLIILLPSMIYQLSEAFPAFFTYFGGGVMGILLFVPIITDSKENTTDLKHFFITESK
jgi:hypothetical protein